MVNNGKLIYEHFKIYAAVALNILSTKKVWHLTIKNSN